MKHLYLAVAISTTLMLSACSDDGASTDTSSGSGSGSGSVPAAQLGAANAASSNITIPDELSSPDNNPDTIAATNDIPTISFNGTTVKPDHTSGDTLFLDGRQSDVNNSELISYQWTQIDNGKPTVSLTDATSSVASFIATPEIDGQRLTFQLTVVALNGQTATSTFSYAWRVEPLPSEVVVVDGPATAETVVPDDGAFVFGQTGSYYAQNISHVYIADQTLNRVVLFDMAKGVELSYFPLPDQPTKFVFLDSTNTLYVALRTSNKLVKIRLTTGAMSEVTIAGPAHSLDAHDGRVYYTVDSPLIDFDLYSVGLNDIPQLHGAIEGDLFKYNPVINEIVAAQTGQSPGTVYRYSLDASGGITELQFSRDLGSNARDISISPDGLQLAVAQGSGNANDYTIHDVSPNDLTVSNGTWDTGAYPAAAEFSPSGDLFAATDTADVQVFDAYSYVQLKVHEIDVNLCGLDYYDVDEVYFTTDEEHVMARLVCGAKSQKTVLFYFSL